MWAVVSMVHAYKSMHEPALNVMRFWATCTQVFVQRNVGNQVQSSTGFT